MFKKALKFLDVYFDLAFYSCCSEDALIYIPQEDQLVSLPHEAETYHRAAIMLSNVGNVDMCL